MNSAALSPPALALNPGTLQLSGPLGWVDVSDPECTLLKAFALSSNHRITTDVMLDLVGKAANDLGKRALEVQIVRLRKKLQQAGAAEPTIKAIRGSGYQLCISLTIGGRHE